MTCPRCGRDAEQRFYGPCEDCRMELRATARLFKPRVAKPTDDGFVYRRRQRPKR